MKDINLNDIKENTGLLKAMLDAKEVPVIHTAPGCGCLQTIRELLTRSYPEASLNIIETRLIIDRLDLKADINSMNLKEGDILIISDYQACVHEISLEITGIVDSLKDSIKIVLTAYDVAVKTAQEKLESDVIDIIGGKIKEGWKELDNTILSGCDMKPVKILFMDKPGHVWYGHVHAYVKYDNRIFMLVYRIHVPNMGSPKCANDAKNIYEFTLDEYNGVTFPKMEDSNFGLEAFWDYTPTRTLEGDNLALRRVMDGLKAWSVQNQMCRQLRKTDKAHLRAKAEMEARHNAVLKK